MIDEKKLVEAVAKAICESVNLEKATQHHGNLVNYNAYNEGGKENYRREAQSAIKAYREQLKAMGE